MNGLRNSLLWLWQILYIFSIAQAGILAEAIGTYTMEMVEDKKT